MTENLRPSSDGKNNKSSLFASQRTLSLVEGFNDSITSPARVSQLLAAAEKSAREELSSKVTITDIDHIPAVSELAVDEREWLRIEDVFVVVADLKGSTKLNFKKHAETGARIFEASTGNAVSIAEQFGPGFIDVQGDGFFALYHGTRAAQRALATAITVKTFGELGLLEALADHVDAATITRTAVERKSASGEVELLDLPDTGYKVGMASGRLLSKHVGTPEWHEPVWAGKPVSWAAKCAQKADAHELIVMERVFKKFENNDYITHSCDCNLPPKNLWEDIEVEGFEEQPDEKFKVLRSKWCEVCGDRFCAALLAGQTDRETVDADVAGVAA